MFAGHLHQLVQEPGLLVVAMFVAFDFTFFFAKTGPFPSRASFTFARFKENSDTAHALTSFDFVVGDHSNFAH